MQYKALGLLLVFTLAIAACKRRQPLGLQHTTSINLHVPDTAKVLGYFTNALSKAHYPAHVQEEALDALSGKWYSAQNHSFHPLIDYYSYFGNSLQHSKTATDSVHSIAKSVYACSNYGWLPTALSNDEFTALNSNAQYYTMQQYGYNGTCGAMSDFLAKTYQQFGFAAVVIHLAVKGSNNDVYSHVAVAVKATGKWYLVESTTGQMLLTDKAVFIDYDTYLKAVADRNLSTIQVTSPTYGKFMQPGNAYNKTMQWVYGNRQAEPSLLKHTNQYTVIQVKRGLSTWVQQATVKGTYIAYLQQKYGTANWLYMYDTANITQVIGSPAAVNQFNSSYFK